MARKALLVCGILSSLLYVAMNVFIPMQWEGYSSASQTVSELSAIGAPTRPLWVPLGTVYTLLVAAFGWGVLASSRWNRPLRVAGGLLVAYGVIGLAWPPMHLREVLAAGGGTLTDTMHIVFAMVTVLLMLLAIGFGAAAFGKRFPPLLHRDHGDPFRVWRLDNTRCSQDPGESAYTVGRGLGAHQHRRLPALGRGAGHHAPTRREILRPSPVARLRGSHESRCGVVSERKRPRSPRAPAGETVRASRHGSGSREGMTHG